MKEQRTCRYRCPEKDNKNDARGDDPAMADELVVKVKLTEPNKVKIDFMARDFNTAAKWVMADSLK